jgi:hypothetical protein
MDESLKDYNEGSQANKTCTCMCVCVCVCVCVCMFPFRKNSRQGKIQFK